MSALLLVVLAPFANSQWLSPWLANSAPFLPYTDLTIQRFWVSQKFFHYYQVVNNSYPAMYIPPGAVREEDVGRVVSATQRDQLGSTCQTPLISMTRYERSQGVSSLVSPGIGNPLYSPYAAYNLYEANTYATYNPVSIFSTTTLSSGNWTARETFYCSPNQGNCGANFPLVMYPLRTMDINVAGDLFYPSNPSQVQVMSNGLVPWLRQGTIACYIWK